MMESDVLFLTVRGFIAVILLAGAADKARSPIRFQGMVANYRLLPHAVVPGFSLVFILAEFAAAVMLLAPGSPWLAAGLIGLSTVGVAVNLVRGRTHIDCGCGGPAGQPISGFIVGRNALLMALLAAVGTRSGAVPSGTGEWAVSVAGMVVMTLAYFIINQLLANRLAFERARG